MIFFYSYLSQLHKAYFNLGVTPITADGTVINDFIIGVGVAPGADALKAIFPAESLNNCYVEVTPSSGRGTSTGALVQINKAFGEVSMLTRADAPDGEFAFAISPVSERDLAEKLAVIKDAEIKSVIRITDY